MVGDYKNRKNIMKNAKKKATKKVAKKATTKKAPAKKAAKKKAAKKAPAKKAAKKPYRGAVDRPLFDAQNRPITPRTPVLSTGTEFKLARMRLAVAFKAKLAALRLSDLEGRNPGAWFDVALSQMIERDRFYAYDARAVVKLRSVLGRVVKTGLTRMVNGYAYTNNRLERLTGGAVA